MEYYMDENDDKPLEGVDLTAEEEAELLEDDEEDDDDDDDIDDLDDDEDDEEVKELGG